MWPTEVTSRWTCYFLEAAEERLGRAATDELLASFGVTRAELRDQTAWVSLRFCERLCEEVALRTGGTEALAHAGRMAFLSRNLGFLYALLRAFGNPESTFRK